MDRFENIFKKNMSSRQVALEYFKISDNYKGEDAEMLKKAFDIAFLDAQHREDAYAFAHSGNGYAYCAD